MLRCGWRWWWFLPAFFLCLRGLRFVRFVPGECGVWREKKERKRERERERGGGCRESESVRECAREKRALRGERRSGVRWGRFRQKREGGKNTRTKRRSNIISGGVALLSAFSFTLVAVMTRIFEFWLLPHDVTDAVTWIGHRCLKDEILSDWASIWVYLQSYSTSSPLLIANERIGSFVFYSKAVWFDLRCVRERKTENGPFRLGPPLFQFPLTLTVSAPSLSVSPLQLVWCNLTKKIREAHQRNYFSKFHFPGSTTKSGVCTLVFFFCRLFLAYH